MVLSCTTRGPHSSVSDLDLRREVAIFSGRKEPLRPEGDLQW